MMVLSINCLRVWLIKVMFVQGTNALRQCMVMVDHCREMIDQVVMLVVSRKVCWYVPEMYVVSSKVVVHVLVMWKNVLVVI